jgi:hypothetical protein
MTQIGNNVGSGGPPCPRGEGVQAGPPQRYRNRMGSLPLARQPGPPLKGELGNRWHVNELIGQQVNALPGSQINH